MDKPKIPFFAWPPQELGALSDDKKSQVGATFSRPGMNTSRKRSGTSPRASSSDEFGFDDGDDAELIDAARQVENSEFRDIDEISFGISHAVQPKLSKPSRDMVENFEANEWQPIRLPNGKWKCNHNCKDKAHCKHLCCREGINVPRRPKPKGPSLVNENHSKQVEEGVKLALKQTTLSGGGKLKKAMNQSELSPTAEMDMTSRQPQKKKTDLQPPYFKVDQRAKPGVEDHRSGNIGQPSNRHGRTARSAVNALSFLPRAIAVGQYHEAAGDVRPCGAPYYGHGTENGSQARDGSKDRLDTYDAIWEEDGHDYDAYLDATNAENENHQVNLARSTQGEDDEDLDKYFGRDTDTDELVDWDPEPVCSLVHPIRSAPQANSSTNIHGFEEMVYERHAPTSDMLWPSTVAKKRPSEWVETSPMFEPDQEAYVAAGLDAINSEVSCPSLKKMKLYNTLPAVHGAENMEEEIQGSMIRRRGARAPELTEEALESSGRSASPPSGEEMLLREFGKYIDFI